MSTKYQLGVISMKTKLKPLKELSNKSLWKCFINNKELYRWLKKKRFETHILLRIPAELGVGYTTVLV